MTAWRRHAQRPLVIAHRGASADELENTLEAFRRAKSDGADGIELDVMRCASGEVVVFHDDDLARLAGRPGAVRSLTWAELSGIDLLPRASPSAEPRGRASPRSARLADEGRRMPLLSQVFDELGPMMVNVELKSRPGWKRLADDGLAASVAALIHAHGAADRTLVSSFDPLLLRRFRAAAPEIATGLLFAHDQARPLRDAWSAPLLRPTAVHPEAALVDQLAVDGWRSRGYAVNVWTVDEPSEVRWLAALGVDAVITNRPAATRKALESVIAS